MDGVVSFVLEPLQYGFMVRALVVSVTVGAVCAVVGSYVVLRGLAFMGDALSHSVLPGLAVAAIVGVSLSWGALAAGVVAAVLIGWLSRRTGLSEDTSIGILFAGLFALGVAMLTLVRTVNVRLDDVLLGQVLGVSQTQVYGAVVMAVLVIGVLALFHKELLFSSFDPVGASVVGLPTGGLTYLLLVLLAVVIVIALQAVGIILVMAMLVTPAATAYLLVRRFVPMMATGALLGATAAVAGLYASYYLNVSSGAAMVLVATALFGAAAVARRRVV